MPAYTLRLGKRTYFISAGSSADAWNLAKTMITDDLPADHVVTLAEGEDESTPCLLEMTVEQVLAERAST